MPTYEITAPNGRVYEITGKGTKEEALAHLQSHLQGNSPPPVATPGPGQTPAPSAADNMASEYGPVDAAMIAAGSEFNNILEGGKMIAGDLFNKPDWRSQAEADREERKRLMAPLEAASPISTAIGSMLPTVAIPGGAGSTILGRAVGSGLSSFGEAAIKSGGDINSDVAMSTVGGVLGNEVGARAGRYIFGSNIGERGPGLISRALGGNNPAPRDLVPVAVSPEHQNMVDMAFRQGISLTPSQKLHSPQLAQVEASLGRSPFFSGPILNVAEQNTATANTIAREAMGVGGHGPITDDVFDQAHEVVGNEISGILGNKAAFPISSDYFNMVDNVANNLGRGITRGRKMERFTENMRDIGMRQYVTVGEYQTIASDLAELARQNKNPEAKRAFYGLRNALDFEFERAYGQLPELRDARNRWRHIKGLELSGAVNGGEFNPSKYYTYLKNQGSGRVTGNSDIAELAKADRYFKAGAVPNSGTPTAQAVTDFANAGLFGKAARMAGGSLTDTYMKYPLAIMGPGATNWAPHAVTSAADVLAPRLGREIGQNAPAAYDAYLNQYLGR